MGNERQAGTGPGTGCEPDTPASFWHGLMKGAFGAGLVLVVLPSLALVFGLHHLQTNPLVGLPVLAIFGITILFGALALISSLFAGLKLSSTTEALALPPGSIRAAIALALIVLFALISVMLYQSLTKPYELAGLDFEEKNAVVKEQRVLVLAIKPGRCLPPKVANGASAPAAPSSGTSAPAGDDCPPQAREYTVHLRQPPGAESADLAKQLLVLIGTLMTSVTSFYFASRTNEAATKNMLSALESAVVPPKAPPVPGVDTAPAAPATDPAELEDCCDAPIGNPTDDADLPPATGAVEPKKEEAP